MNLANLDNLPLLLIILAWIIFQLSYTKAVREAWGEVLSGNNRNVRWVLLDVALTVILVLVFITTTGEGI